MAVSNPYQARLSKDEKELYVRFPSTDGVMLQKIRQIPARKFVEEGRYWRLKINIDSLRFVSFNGYELLPKDLPKLSRLTDQLLASEDNRLARLQYSQATFAPIVDSVAAKMKLKAWPYQWAPLHYALLCDGGFFLADDMAAGKSVESLMIVNHDKWAHKPVLVITPQPATYNKEIYKFFGDYGFIINGPLYGLLPNTRYYLCSPHRLKFLFEDGDYRKPKPFLKDAFVIIDESHLYKNNAAQRTRFVRALLRRVKHKVIMSGTPVMNRPDELYTQLALLDGDFMSWHQFMRQFCGLEYNQYGMKHDGATNLQALHRYCFENVFVRREKDQIQDQLPEKMRDSVELKVTPEPIEAESTFELFSRSAEFKAKDKDFLDWVETAINSVPKVGIFCHHKIMIQAMQDLCTKMGVKYVTIDGTTKSEERQDLATAFAEDPDARVAILSISVAGTGINDLQAANLCIFAELSWTPGAIIQAENRFHRPGLKNALLVLYPLVTNFEYALCQLILKKVGIIKRITGPEEIPDSFDDDSLMKQIAAEFNLPIGRRV